MSIVSSIEVPFFFEMDDHTLQLITASLEAEGLIGAADKAVELFKEKYK